MHVADHIRAIWRQSNDPLHLDFGMVVDLKLFVQDYIQQ